MLYLVALLLCRFVAYRLSLIAYRLSLVAYRLSLVACCLSLVALSLIAYKAEASCVSSNIGL